MGIGTDEHHRDGHALQPLIWIQVWRLKYVEMNGKHQQVENTLQVVPSTPHVTIRSSSLCLGLTKLVTPWKGHSALKDAPFYFQSFLWGFLKRRAPTPSKVGNTFHAKTHGLEVG